jgi:hypothetical protein
MLRWYRSPNDGPQFQKKPIAAPQLIVSSRSFGSTIGNLRDLIRKNLYVRRGSFKTPRLGIMA